MSEQDRRKFRRTVFNRDDNTCTVPWCDATADDAHHIIERGQWDSGGYIPDNGASVCNHHHKHAEENNIPPQAFWQWIGIPDPPTPTWGESRKRDMCELWAGVDSLDELDETWNVDKWGEPFRRPPHEHLKDHVKYQSSRHLMPLYWHDETCADERIENDDTQLHTLSDFTGIPLVITEKIDGGNCMVVSDESNPVRARNGSSPEDTMRPLYRPGGLYWEHAVNHKLPRNLEVFGEWVYAKHNIHYGCTCEPSCDDTAPPLSEVTGIDGEEAYFQIFGVYNTDWNLWLSWNKTEEIANTLGFPTTPVLYCEDDVDKATFETEQQARRKLTQYAHDIIDRGGEGIVVRSKFPYHYGQFPNRLGKYVRENHVKDTDTHWSKRKLIENVI